MLEQVEMLLDQGYESLKVKVGRDDLAVDINRTQQIKRRVQGRASLRLDANRSWSLAQAMTFARAVGTDQIEYIEEPTIRREDHVLFYQATSMPYAWDESLMEVEVQEAEGLAALVIKPARLGALEKADHLVAWAKCHGKRAVISSVFESNLALTFYAEYCLVRGLEDVCHGLDTWRWLNDVPPVKMEQGRMVVG